MFQLYNISPSKKKKITARRTALFVMWHQESQRDTITSRGSAGWVGRHPVSQCRQAQAGRRWSWWRRKERRTSVADPCRLKQIILQSLDHVEYWFFIFPSGIPGMQNLFKAETMVTNRLWHSENYIVEI